MAYFDIAGAAVSHLPKATSALQDKALHANIAAVEKQTEQADERLAMEGDRLRMQQERIDLEREQLNAAKDAEREQKSWLAVSQAALMRKEGSSDEEATAALFGALREIYDEKEIAEFKERFDPDGNMVIDSWDELEAGARIRGASFLEEEKPSVTESINLAANFTPESIRAFEESGYSDPSVLKPKTSVALSAKERADLAKNFTSDSVKAFAESGYQDESLLEPRATNKNTATAGQFKAGGFYARIKEANTIFDDLEGDGADFTNFLDRVSGGNLFPQGWKSEDRQAFEQASRNFINAVLRRESGAAIAPSEFESAELQYFPVPGDSKEVVLQKRANRKIVEATLKAEAGPAAALIEAEIANMPGYLDPGSAGEPPPPPSGFVIDQPEQEKEGDFTVVDGKLIPFITRDEI